MRSLLLLCLLVILISSPVHASSILSSQHRHARGQSSQGSAVARRPLRPAANGFDPIANPKAIIPAGHARFTVLTEYIIRCEWSINNQFQDKATWVAVRRNLPLPIFTARGNTTHTIITTQYVTLTYLTNSQVSFNSDNIQITTTWNAVNPYNGNVALSSSTWSAVNKEETVGNLRGTFRTLDGNNGDAYDQLDCQNQGSDGHCTYGVISTNGYALIDDTHQPSYADVTVPWPWISTQTWSPPSNDLCMMADNMKRDCGYIGIDGNTCRMKGCCWTGGDDVDDDDDTDAVDPIATPNGIPTCFYSTQSDQDLYFLGHGHNFTMAIKEFTLISGDIPLPPRYAFGVFFSRYWAYADYEEKQIIKEYVTHAIPMDVLVIDMDWHITMYKQASQGKKDQAGQTIGWSGFTFDNHLYMNPQAFMDWCHSLGIKNTYNIHPASGIQPWEATYTQMAIAMGIDPSTGHYVPFNITDQKYITNWMNITMAGLEHAGTALWWLDWQQGEGWINNIPDANPTFWLNYVFFTNPYHWSNGKRPALLHRWGGLGNHRYQVGFSGDVHPSWDSLTWQPYFTATAANVGYTYWSHDLGGHTAPPDPELYTRWLQWGAFSPMFRTHCTKNVDNDRRIYTYPWAYYPTLRAFSKLRQSLGPYLYTSGRRTYDTSLGIVLPLYYLYPEYNEAYDYNHQHTYFFGPDMFIAPVTVPVSADTSLANVSYWLPPGSWVNIFTGDLLKGPMIVNRSYTIWEMPSYAQIGSIIPLLPDSAPPLSQAQLTPMYLRLLVIVGGSASGQGQIYDDNGDDPSYQQAGNYAYTRFSYNVDSSGTMMTFMIEAASGSYTGFPQNRQYEIHIRGVTPATKVVLNNQATLLYELYNELSPMQVAGIPSSNNNAYTYDGATLSLIIYIRQPYATNQPLSLSITLADTINLPILTSSTGYTGQIARFINAKALLDDQWGTSGQVYQDDYPNLLYAAQMGEAITYDPTNTLSYLKQFSVYQQLACTEVRGNISNLQPALQRQLLAQLC